MKIISYFNLEEKRYLVLFLLFLTLIFRIYQYFPLSANSSLEIDSPGFFLDLRQKLADQSNILLPPTQAALLNGIVLGLKSDLPSDFKKALTNTSTVHIVVASGQNLTLLSGFVLTLTPLFGRKKVIFSSILVCLFYCLLTGLQIPIIRAALMIIFAGLGKLFDREVDSWYALVLVALLMLIFEPNWLLSISFQLSFLATAGVIVLAPELIKRVQFLPEVIREDLAVSFCAQLVTAPILAANFHQFSLSGLFANILVLWTVSPLMISGAFIILIAFVYLPIAAILSLIPNIMLTYFIYIINFFNQPWSSVWVAKMNSFVWYGFYILVISFYFFLKRHNQRSEILKSEELSAQTQKCYD